jgi:hypothetical protein
MAQAAGNLDGCEQSKTIGTLVPMRSGPSAIATGQEMKEGSSIRPSMRGRVDEGKQWASYALVCAQQTVAELYRTTRRHAGDAYLDASSASRDLTERVRYRAEIIKKEHPLQLLAVIAGSAIVGGVAARIWRSRRHA